MRGATATPFVPGQRSPACSPVLGQVSPRRCSLKKAGPTGVRILPREWGKEKPGPSVCLGLFPYGNSTGQHHFRLGWDHMVSRITHCFTRFSGWERLSLSVAMNQTFPICYLGVTTLRLINSFVTCADSMKGVTGDLECTASKTPFLPSAWSRLESSFSQRAPFTKAQAAGGRLLLCCVLCILKFLAYSWL